MAGTGTGSSSLPRVAALLLAMCMLAPCRCKRDSSFGEDDHLLQPARSKGPCASAAMLLMTRNRQAFNGILKRGHVYVSDDGEITLPLLKNTIPYEGIEKPSAVLGDGGSGVASYEPKIKSSVDGVTQTIRDLKALLGILGVKELKVKGMAGGPNYGPGGANYKEEWTEGWMKVAEKRALALLKQLGLASKEGVSVEGALSTTIGVEITVTSLMRISVMKNLDSIHEDCGPLESEVKSLSIDDLTPESIVQAANEVLARGNIGFTQDEMIALQDQAFHDNVIPFKRCDGQTGKTKLQRLKECKKEVAINATHVGKAQAAMRDIADLSRIVGVTSFAVTGYTKAKPETEAEELAAQALGAARARLLVGDLKEFSKGTPLVKFSNDLYDDMTACMDSGEDCDDVSQFGQIAVKIHMATLTNPLALGQ